MTVQQLTRCLRISRQRVYQLINEGRIEVYREDGKKKYFIGTDEFNRLLHTDRSPWTQRRLKYGTTGHRPDTRMGPEKGTRVGPIKPWASKAQRAKFLELLETGKVTQEVVDMKDAATIDFESLPERVGDPPTVRTVEDEVAA